MVVVATQRSFSDPEFPSGCSSAFSIYGFSSVFRQLHAMPVIASCSAKGESGSLAPRKRKK